MKAPKIEPSCDVHVTDHGLIRYLERVIGLDMDGYRRQLAEEIAPAAMTGARSVKIGPITFQLDRGTLITVIREDRPKKRLRPMREEADY